jgi:20S proteasome alpha/beta subunit
MTIAAGYLASDGILICADTEHADDVAKYKKPKVFKFKKHLIVTGAGNSHLLKLATDRLFRALAQPPADIDGALSIVGDVIYELHERHIFKHYDATNHLRPTVSLIVAARCANGKLTIIKTQDDSAAFGGAYASVGCGSYLFEYWASHFFDRQLDIEAASYLLLFCTAVQDS